MHAIDQAELHPTPAGPQPMLETADRITVLDSYRTYRVGVAETDEWAPLSCFADPSTVSSQYEALVELVGDRRMAAAMLGRSVASTVTLIWVFPVLAENRFPLCSISETRIHWNEGGWIDAVAVQSQRFAVLPGDPAAGMPEVEIIPDREALYGALARRLTEVESLFATIRDVCGIGWPALWGELADQIGDGALRLARSQSRDRWAAWCDAEAIIDRLGDLQEKVRTRPRPYKVTWSDREELFAVRGTCCLYYRSEKSSPKEERYCFTCPLKSDEWRTPLLQEYLEGNPRR